jgi:hypothetical protein
VITITGIGDHLRPEWLIIFTGMRTTCRRNCDRPRTPQGGWPIRLVCNASARRQPAGWSPCRRVRRRYGCLPSRRLKCWPTFPARSTGWPCLSATCPARWLASRRLARVPDWLPALVNGARAFVTIGAAELFWIVTAWPNGAEAITFAAIVVILFAPQADQTYASAIWFMAGCVVAAAFAAIIKFAVLPGLGTFIGFSAVIGLYLVPAGALMTRMAVLAAMVTIFVPLLAPANQMSYDTGQFYNAALAIVAGSCTGAVSFRLVPPLSPAFRRAGCWH